MMDKKGRNFARSSIQIPRQYPAFPPTRVGGKLARLRKLYQFV